MYKLPFRIQKHILKRTVEKYYKYQLTEDYYSMLLVKKNRSEVLNHYFELELKKYIEDNNTYK